MGTGQGQRLSIPHQSKIVSRSTRTQRSSETPNKWTCMACPVEASGDGGKRGKTAESCQSDKYGADTLY